MTKRLIEIDDELLFAARRALDTTGVSDTVRTALRLAADGPRRTDAVAPPAGDAAGLGVASGVSDEGGQT